MVESPLAGFAPVDQLEGAALMFDVAALALDHDPAASAGLSALSMRCLDRRMAGEAESPVDAAIGGVAVEATVAAVELGMGVAQLAGRDLAARRRRCEQRAEDRGCGQDALRCPAATQGPIPA